MTSSTDVAVQQQQAVALPSLTMAVSSVVATWKDDLDHCTAFAAKIIDTPFVPAGLWPAPIIRRGDQAITLKASGRDAWDFRRRHPMESDEDFAWRKGNAVATTAAIVYSGANLKLNWQAALSGIYVANGRTSLYAEQMRALILADGHIFDIVERTADRCTISVARRGETKPTQFAFTMAEAITAGYVKGKGPNVGEDKWKGNDRYNTNPADMLFARTTSISAKAKFADVIRGMETRETLDDERPAPVDITAQVEVSTPAERPTREAILAAAGTSPAPEVPVAGTSAPPEVPEPPQVQRAVLPLSEAGWRRINARFNDMEVVGPGQTATRLRVISHIVGRTVTRGSELTADEGGLVLDNLTGDAGYTVLDAALDRGPAQPAPAPAVETADGDEVLGDDDYDPTTEAGYGEMDGAEAAGEERLG